MRRLGPLDSMFLYQERPTAPHQIASLVILAANSDGLDLDRLIQTITERIDLVPGYRQIPRPVPGSIGSPVWVDDESFDPRRHVRRSTLPEPGTCEELNELVSQLIGRGIDPDRPLWEVYLIDGLSDGRLALLFKSHQALVDGSQTVDLAQVLLEEAAHQRDIPQDPWRPRPQPTNTALISQALVHNVRHPVDALRTTELNLTRLARRLPLIGSASDTSTGSLSATLSRYRRFAQVRARLDDFRRVRDEHGGTVNDVVLAVLAGGLRSWMLTRAQPVSTTSVVRAMVPMSVVDEEGLPTSLGSKVRGHLVPLPVGESNPVVRLHQVSYALKAHRETGSAVAANELAALPGFATSTFHAVGARVAEAESARGHQLVITNVPGPREVVYMAGEPVTEVYPCIPLTGNRALAVGVTSYHGSVFFGLVADREALSDLDVLAQCISESLDELVETVESRRSRAPRGRLRPDESE